jgi:hypothetical protein
VGFERYLEAFSGVSHEYRVFWEMEVSVAAAVCLPPHLAGGRPLKSRRGGTNRPARRSPLKR